MIPFIRTTTVIVSMMFLAVPMSAQAETYQWVDEQGNMHFSDTPPSMPRSKRSKVKVREDITSSGQTVREGSKESQRQAGGSSLEEQERMQKRWAREAEEERERQVYQARDRRLKEELAKREQQQAQEARRRLDTSPVQRSAEELGGFTVKSGST